jgi:hypothetical protein
VNLVENYIADALVNWFMVEVQVAILFNYRNKSTGKNDSQWSTPIDYTEHRYLKDNYKPRAEYFTNRLESFLCANSQKFPKYNSTTSSDQLFPEDTAPSNPVFLGPGIGENPNKKFINSSDEP